MEFSGALGELDAYYLERRELEVRNGRLHAEVWRLKHTALLPEPQIQVQKRKLKAEIQENSTRMRTLSYLINKTRLQCFIHNNKTL